MQRQLEGQSYIDYLRKLAPKEQSVLKFIVVSYINNGKQAIPVREVTKGLSLSASRTSQLITALEQYEVIETQIQRHRGNFRVIEPDQDLVRKVENKELELPGQI